MNKQVIGQCPICQEELIVTKLTCPNCKTDIVGEFELSRFNHLSKEQLNFVLVFIKNQGNIKMIEKELGISYPTVKKNLDDVIIALGYKVVDDKRSEILNRLKNGEIDFDEAEKLLQKLGR